MPKKRKNNIKVKVNKVRKPNRYNALQTILSDYGREHNITWGKGQFSKKCSILNDKTKQFDIKFVAQNIDILYKDYLVDNAIKRNFPTGPEFAWWYFVDELQTPIFDDVTVSFTFDDSYQQFNFKGNRIEAQAYWEDVCYRYFRTHYSVSPWAYFELEKTDNKTYADYKIIPGIRQELGQTTTKLPTDEQTALKQGVSTETDKLIALEKEKQATMDRVLELVKAGFTKEEIFKIIGK
jgi:hypothetical protein